MSTTSKQSNLDRKLYLMQKSNQHGNINGFPISSSASTSTKTRNTYAYKSSPKHSSRRSSSASIKRSKRHSNHGDRRGSTGSMAQKAYHYKPNSNSRRASTSHGVHHAAAASDGTTKPPLSASNPSKKLFKQPTSAWTSTYSSSKAESVKTLGWSSSARNLNRNENGSHCSPTQSPSQTLDARSQKLKRPSISSQLNSSVSSIGSGVQSRSSRTAQNQRVTDYYLWCGKPSTFRGDQTKARKRPSSAVPLHHKTQSFSTKSYQVAEDKPLLTSSPSEGKIVNRIPKHSGTRQHIQLLSSKNETLRRELERIQIGRHGTDAIVEQSNQAPDQCGTQTVESSMFWGNHKHSQPTQSEQQQQQVLVATVVPNAEKRPHTAQGVVRTSNDNNNNNAAVSLSKKNSVEILELDSAADGRSSTPEQSMEPKKDTVGSIVLQGEPLIASTCEEKDHTNETVTGMDVETKIASVASSVAGTGVMAVRKKLSIIRNYSAAAVKETHPSGSKNSSLDPKYQQESSQSNTTTKNVQAQSTTLKLGQFFKSLQHVQKPAEKNVEKAPEKYQVQLATHSNEEKHEQVPTPSESQRPNTAAPSTRRQQDKLTDTKSTQPKQATVGRLGAVHHHLSSNSNSSSCRSTSSSKLSTNGSVRNVSTAPAGSTRSSQQRTSSSSQESERERLRAVVSQRDWNGLGQPDMYVFGKLLGQGSFGTVRLAHQKITGHKVAVKTYEKAKMKDPGQFKRCRQEIVLMQKLNHPNVICLFETFETSKRIHLVMEAATGGNLCSYVKKHKRLTEKEAIRILHQLVSGVEYLHSNRMVHRDIKLENVLFDSERNLKLVDYGFSVVAGDAPLKVFCGTPSYMAPEIVKRKEYRGSPVDIWSLGVLLYAMLCGCFPFTAKSYPDLYKKILRGVFHIPDKISTYMRDLLRRMLFLDPEKRFTIKHVRQHPVLQQANLPTTFRPEECFHLIASKPENNLDNSLIKQLTNFGFSHEALVSSIASRRKNHLTTSYYLLGMKTAKKRLRIQQQARETSRSTTETQQWLANRLQDQQRPATSAAHSRPRAGVKSILSRPSSAVPGGTAPKYGSSSTRTSSSRTSGSLLKIPVSIDHRDHDEHKV